MSIAAVLRRHGVMGINERNARYTLRCNPRRLYPTVDNKLITKGLCQKNDIPVPRPLAVVRKHFELHTLEEQLKPHTSFVLKPVKGAMGNGILVITGRDGDDLVRTGDRRISLRDFSYHAASIISGLYALGGQADIALVEELVQVDSAFDSISFQGVPDIRVILYRGIPVMAMTRLPTRRSGGRANLHQGALAAGVDLSTGRTIHAISGGSPIRRHPDTDTPVLGFTIPHFERVVEIATRATDCTGLGYVGADVVIDATKGPMILELNARPGLAIQLANRAGLRPRLEAIDRSAPVGAPVAERIQWSAELAARSGKVTAL